MNNQGNQAILIAANAGQPLLANQGQVAMGATVDYIDHEYESGEFKSNKSPVEWISEPVSCAVLA
ncbi:hypothetical protein FS842_010873 [Serendipita sp. 407]|nr:hypothetical protein FS842_010873 [Serendipita sp. 407]